MDEVEKLRNENARLREEIKDLSKLLTERTNTMEDMGCVYCRISDRSMKIVATITKR